MIFQRITGSKIFVRLRTSTGEYNRPIQRLFRLESSPAEFQPDNLSVTDSANSTIANVDKSAVSVTSEVSKSHQTGLTVPKSQNSVSEKPKPGALLTAPVNSDSISTLTRTGRLVRPPNKLNLVFNSKFVHSNSFFVF